MAPLAELGFALAGYGCTTCIGNSRAARRAGREGDRGGRARRRRRAVGQPQLRGPRPSARPRLVPRLAAARRRVRARGPGRHRPHHRAARAPGRDGAPVMLADIWPSPDEVRAVIGASIDPELFRETYAVGVRGRRALARAADPRGRPVRLGRRPPRTSPTRRSSRGSPPSPRRSPTSRAPACSRVLGDSVTTDHISPAGSIAAWSPAGPVAPGARRRAASTSTRTAPAAGTTR